jgi:hypothetical protein
MEDGNLGNLETLLCFVFPSFWNIVKYRFSISYPFSISNILVGQAST